MQHTHINALLVCNHKKDCFLQQLLDEMQSLDVKRAKSFSEGAQIIADQQIDVILLDIHQREPALHQATVENIASVPIIVIASEEYANGEKIASLIGAVDFLKHEQINRLLLARVLQYAVETDRLHQTIIAHKQQVAEFEIAREELAHRIVHDLRSPLTAISLSLQLLEEDLAATGNASHQRIIKVARRNARRMLNLINNILDFTRLEQTEIPLKRKAIYLDALIDEVITTYQTFITDKNLNVEIELPPFVPSTMGDDRIMLRVIQNLFDNAVKFSPDGGHIGIKLKLLEQFDSDKAGDSTQKLQVSMTDNGAGVPVEIHAKLFNKFVTGKQLGRGSGLGLAFCKLAVEAHDGHIWFESNPDSNTTFIFEIPVCRE